MINRYEVWFEISEEYDLVHGFTLSNLLPAIRKAQSLHYTKFAWIVDLQENKFCYVRHQDKELWPLVWENFIASPPMREKVREGIRKRMAKLRFTSQPQMEIVK